MDRCIDGGALFGWLPPMLYFLRAGGARASTLIVCIAEKEGVADVVGGVAWKTKKRQQQQLVT